LREFLERWERYVIIRSRIENFMKAWKVAFVWDLVHRYMERSAAKYVALGVLLVGLVISLGFGDKEALQRLAEW